jgi:DNA-binding HxlR family transcriptional regulator
LDKPLRFNQLQEQIENITSSTLSDRLKKLNIQKIVKREQYQCIPPKVEYSLTKKGKDLKNIVEAIGKFGKKWYRSI